MFVYLFLIAALVTAPELPNATGEEKEPQKLITALTPEPTILESLITETPVPVKETIIAIAAEPIVITNAIDETMLKYKHWTGTYSPETFTITVNGTEVAQGAHHTVPANTKTIDVMFNYSFMNGMRTGTKTISYELHDNITQAHITFSWKDDHKILLDNGTLIKVTA